MKTTFVNFYEILGVPRDATVKQIKAAKKKLSQKHHPDREGGDEELMKTINQAHDVLIDPAKRAQHDRDIRAAEAKAAQEKADAEAAAKKAAQQAASKKAADEAKAKAQEQAKKASQEEEYYEERGYTQEQMFKMDIERLKAKARLEAERIKAEAKLEAERIKAEARMRERQPQFDGEDFGEANANVYSCLCKRCKGRGVITIAHGNGLRDMECPVCAGSGVVPKKAA